MEQNFITASEIARRYGFSIQAVQKWRERGIPFNTNLKKFPEKDSTEWVVSNILEPLKQIDTNEALKLAKLKKAESEARITEMNERTQAGSLIPVPFVEAALSKWCSTVRGSMLQIATTQSGYLLEQAQDVQTLKKALTLAITERLTEIGSVMESGAFIDDPLITQFAEDTEDDHISNDSDDRDSIQNDDAVACRGSNYGCNSLDSNDDPEFFDE